MSFLGKLFTLGNAQNPKSAAPRPLTCHPLPRRPGRREKRSSHKLNVLLSNGREPMFAELAYTENVSSNGVRVRTELPWKPGTRIFFKSSKGKSWARARVVYCRPLQPTTHALGLEFYASAHRYNLTFRCINCGSCAASANYRSNRLLRAEQIKAQIFRVNCATCGWKGDAPGFSAVQILRYKSSETYGSDENALRSPLSPKPVRQRSLPL